MTRTTLKMIGAAACLVTLAACDTQEFAELFPAAQPATTQAAPAPVVRVSSPAPSASTRPGTVSVTVSSQEAPAGVPVNPHLNNNPFLNVSDGGNNSSGGSNDSDDGDSGSGSGGSSGGSGSGGGGWTG
jgi:uncharacterized membrane protein YgcG